MVKKRLKNPIFLFYILVSYVIVQFSWWLYLMFSMYKTTYSNPIELEHKTWMLIGEGSVFLILLLGGVYMIRKAFKREKEVNEFHENFLQSVSHELKTPIASVGLYLQTLEKHELDEKKRKDIYSRSLHEIERLNMLVSDILTARNIENSNYFFDPKEVNLKEHLGANISRLLESILKNHEVEYDLENITIKTDKTALDSVFYNLVENAVKYSPKESKIIFSLFKRDKKTVFTISDEGKGVENSHKETVFKKFYRLENETTRKSKGTGLGLHISKFLIESQGGIIKLLDNKPTGLIVEITF